MAETFILTCAGGRMMPALVAGLRSAWPNRRIVGVDADAAVSASPPRGFDRVFPVPRATAADYVDVMMKTSRDFAPAILVPGSDEEAGALAPHADRFAKAGIAVNVSPPGAVAIMRDKVRATDEAMKAGCRVPKTIKAESFDALRKAILALGYPEKVVVIKPVSGRGRRATFFVSRMPLPLAPDVPPSCALEEIKDKIGAWPGPMLACETVRGSALTADMLCDRGTLVGLVVRRWAGAGRFPFPGQDIVERPQLAASLAPLVKQIGIHGLVDADLIETADGEAYLLEINPRPSGSVPVTLAAGIPLYDALADILCGRPVNPLNKPVRSCITASDLDAMQTVTA